MNRTQASIYHLGDTAPTMPDFSGYTDVTESTVFLALFGPEVFLYRREADQPGLHGSGQKGAFLAPGPLLPRALPDRHPGQISDGNGGFLLTCSRGYGDSMVHAMLEAGAEFGLRPAGENRFSSWIQELQG